MVVVSSKPVDFFLSLIYLSLESMYDIHIHNKPVTLEAFKKHDGE